MAKPKVTDWSATAADNEDIGGIDIRGTAKPSNIDNAEREMMAQIAKVNAGTDPVADTWSFADPADLTKIVRLDAGNITTGNTRVITAPDRNMDLAKVPDASLAQSFTTDEKAQLLENIGAAWELIGTATPSGASSVDFTDLEDFRVIRAIGVMVPSTDDRSLIIQTSTNNGSSYDSTASDYVGTNTAFTPTNAVAISAASITTALTVTQTGVGNAAGEMVSFDITLSNFNQAAPCEYRADVYYINASGTPYRSFNAGRRVQSTARDAVRFLFATGNCSGFVKVMGIRG